VKLASKTKWFRASPEKGNAANREKLGTSGENRETENERKTSSEPPEQVKNAMLESEDRRSERHRWEKIHRRVSYWS